MALDFGILQPANISGQLQAGQESAMRNQLAQQQLASGRTEQEMSQMKLSELRRNTAALETMQRKFVENGKSDDMESNYQAMIASGIPQFIDIGFKGRQLLAQTRQDYTSMGLPVPAYLQPKGQGAAPATGAPAAAAPAGSEDRLGDFISQIEAKQNAPMPMPAVTGGALPPAAASNMLAPAPAANMLAPATAPAAPVNALAAPGMSAEEQRARTMLLSSNPGVRAAGQTELNRLTALHTLSPGGTLRDAKGNIIAQAPEATPADVRTMQLLGYPATQAGYAAFRDAQRQERILTPEEEAQKIRIANASRPPLQPVAPTITTIEDPNKPGSFLQVDARTYRGGGAGSPGVIGGARPSATAEKLTLQRTQMGKDLGFAITQLGDITKDGGLIDQSTGSGAGKLADIGAGFVGIATPGAIAIGKIAPIADLVLKMVPRFEGPQSNKDTQSYKEAAGQLADASLPTEIRKQAGKTVLRIMTERKNQFVTTDMAAEGAGAAQIAPPAGFVPDQR